MGPALALMACSVCVTALQTPPDLRRAEQRRMLSVRLILTSLMAMKTITIFRIGRRSALARTLADDSEDSFRPPRSIRGQLLTPKATSDVEVVVVPTKH
jgi:hypothetical protein